MSQLPPIFKDAVGMDVFEKLMSDPNMNEKDTGTMIDLNHRH